MGDAWKRHGTSMNNTWKYMEHASEGRKKGMRKA